MQHKCTKKARKFAQEINDAVGLRRRVGQCFELAALPGTLEADRKKLLRFVVVGGGPTGAVPATPA